MNNQEIPSAETGSEDSWDPVVVGANWYRFRPDERIRHESVASVCYLWVVSGSGTITSRGRSYAISSHDLIRLPWRHDVEYLADPQSPFFVGTVHLVPRHLSSKHVVPRAPYQPDDPLLRVAWREGDSGDSAFLLNGAERSVAQAVTTLGTYCIETFTAGHPKEPLLKALGVLFADLDEQWLTRAVTTTVLPNRLRLMTEYASARLSDPTLTVEEIATAAGCSSATARRLFTEHLGQPVLSWVREKRLNEAASTLRTTGMRVREVARLVGFTDPLYFSRVFSERFGVPPSRYVTEELRP